MTNIEAIKYLLENEGKEHAVLERSTMSGDVYRHWREGSTFCYGTVGGSGAAYYSGSPALGDGNVFSLENPPRVKVNGIVACRVYGAMRPVWGQGVRHEMTKVGHWCDGKQSARKADSPNAERFHTLLEKSLRDTAGDFSLDVPNE